MWIEPGVKTVVEDVFFQRRKRDESQISSAKSPRHIEQVTALPSSHPEIVVKSAIKI